MTNRPLGVLGALLLLSPLLSAQDGAAFLALTVELNGREIPAPDHVKLSYDGQSVQAALREGKFEIPAGAAGAKNLTFEADLDGEHIRIDGIAGPFVHENWKLILADKSYGDDFEWVLKKSKRVKVGSSCILAFEPTDGDGTFLFVSDCRRR
jgi:hypothetical protein